MSNEFRDGLEKFLRERLRTLPAGWRARMLRAENFAEMAGYFFEAYPNGGLTLRSKPEEESVLVHAVVYAE